MGGDGGQRGERIALDHRWYTSVCAVGELQSYALCKCHGRWGWGRGGGRATHRFQRQRRARALWRHIPASSDGAGCQRGPASGRVTQLENELKK